MTPNPFARTSPYVKRAALVLAVSVDQAAVGTGLSPLAPPAAAMALLRLKLGALSYAPAGSKLALVPSRDLSVSYMGSAARDVAVAVTTH